MATSLDLQEQEQLDAVKAFWNKHGNLITWVLVLVLGAFAGWNGWQWYQRDQGGKAGALYDELDRAAGAGEVDKVAQRFADLKQRFPGTAFAVQGALLTAKVQFDKGKVDDAKATLGWVVEKAGEAEVRTVARLRLAALHAEAKQYDEALKALDAAKGDGAESFAALVADRRGDVLMLQGKKDEAAAAWQAAFAAMSEKVEYRRLVEAKLTSIGVAPAASAAASPAQAAASGAAAASAAGGAAAASASK